MRATLFMRELEPDLSIYDELKDINIERGMFLFLIRKKGDTSLCLSNSN